MNDLAEHLFETALAMNRAAAEQLTPEPVEPLTAADWDGIYDDAESNGEGEPRAMVRYAYEAGFCAASGIPTHVTPDLKAALLEAGWEFEWNEIHAVLNAIRDSALAKAVRK